MQRITGKGEEIYIPIPSGACRFSLLTSSFSTGTKVASASVNYLSLAVLLFHTWCTGCLWLPLGTGLFFAKTLVVVTLSSKELFEVGLAVHNSLHGCIVSEGNDYTAVATLETGLVEHLLTLLLLNYGLLGGIDSLVAHMALLSVQCGLTEPRGLTIY